MNTAEEVRKAKIKDGLKESILLMPMDKRMDFIASCLCESGVSEFKIRWNLDDGGGAEINYSKK